MRNGLGVMGAVISGLVLAVACASSPVRVKDEPSSVIAPDVPSPSPVRKGNRILGIDTNAAEDNNFDAAFRATKSAGAQVVSLSINWNDVEKTPGKFAPNPNWLAVANAYYAPRKTPLSLVLRPMDTNGRQTPRDLARTKFDDPAMIEQFKALTDYVFTQIPDLQLVSLALGNEVDLGIGKNETLWKEYEVFYREAARHVKDKHPNVKVGVVATLYGLTRRYRSQLEALNRSSDIVLVTYYPLNDDLTVKDPSVVPGEIEELLKLYPGRTIYFTEAGYPSSTVVKSSLEKQRQFIKEIFLVWDRHPSQIGMIMFSWLTDSSPQSLELFKKYYRFADPRFVEFLRSLGLRTYPGSGTDKPAFEALKTEAKRRGW